MSAPRRDNETEELELELGGGDLAFTLADFEALAEILHREVGIVLERGKAPLVYSRLAKRVRATGLTSFRSYCRHISTEQGAGERRLMLEALTTNVTRFLREAHHFDHLTSDVLPELAAAARRGARVRLWSAGCSSGEEPYSIALALLAVMPDAARHDIKILATDIDTQVLARGREGVYPNAAVALIKAELRERWLTRTADESHWRVGDEMRKLVAFRAANLIDQAWPMAGPFQVIFCRNVVIYFDDETRARVLHKLVDLLSPAGHIYIGHSERIDPAAEDVRFVGLSTYRRLGSPDGHPRAGQGFAGAPRPPARPIRQPE